MDKKEIQLFQLLFLIISLLTNSNLKGNNLEHDSLKISQPIYDVQVEENMPVPMSDGTILRADIYRPIQPGNYPVLVGRHAYKLKDWAMGHLYPLTGNYYASRGYVVIWQNCRGTFASEGDYYPFRDDAWGENQDGYETIEWAAQQPWSNGKVGMIGVSYSGLTQYLLAPTRPPHLKALFVQMGWGAARNCLFQDGIFELYDISWFPLGMTLLQIQDDTITPGIDTLRKSLANVIGNIEKWNQHLPYKDLPPLKGIADWYFEWLDHDADGPFWHSTDVSTMYNEVDVPILHWNGWYDYRLDATLDAFIGISKEGVSEQCRKNQYLVIGPWTHVEVPTGVLDFGSAANLNAEEYRLRWYDYWLKDYQNGINKEKPVKIFLMGDNKWIEFDSWPPKDIQNKTLFLHEGKEICDESLNNGILTIFPPESAEQADGYIYDPEDPIVSKRNFINTGPQDYSDIEYRMLTYTTEVFEQDLVVVGSVKAEIYAKSSAKDTDWLIRLCDVWPDGRSISVCEGIIRARYRNSTEQEELLNPNQIYKYEIELSATAQVFKAGHSLRIQITSSDFPYYDKNLNTGGTFGEETKGQKAINTIFHDITYPSQLVLPVLQ